MPKYQIEMACMVPAYINFTVDAPDAATARRWADEAATCFNATPQLTIPDEIGREMPRTREWMIDHSGNSDWEVLGVEDAE